MNKNANTELRSVNIQTKRFGLKMLSPTVVVLLIMTTYPLLFTLVYSFTNYNLLRSLKNGSKFISLGNYTKLLSDPYFQQSILNTVKFTILAVIFEMIVGLAVALFVNSLTRGQKTLRTLVLLPYLLPTVTVALSWRMMLSPNYGIVNQVLQALHLPIFTPPLVCWYSLMYGKAHPSYSCCCMPHCNPCRRVSTRPPASTVPEFFSNFGM